MPALLLLLTVSALGGRFFGADPYRSPDQPHFGSVEGRVELLWGQSWTMGLEVDELANAGLWQLSARGSVLLLPGLAASTRGAFLVTGATTEEDWGGEGYVQTTWFVDLGGTLALRPLRLSFYTCPVQRTRLHPPTLDDRVAADYQHWAGVVELDLSSEELDLDSNTVGLSVELRRTRLQLEDEWSPVPSTLWGWGIVFGLVLHAGRLPW